MSPASRKVAPSQIEPPRAVVERKILSLGGHREGRSMSTRFLEEPMKNPDGEDYRGLNADPNLGLGEELEFLLARHNRVMKCCLRSVPGLPLYMEMQTHNILIFQLEWVLSRHWLEVSKSEAASKWIDRWLEKRKS